MQQTTDRRKKSSGLITTSYFANLRNINTDEFCPVSIALHTPRWYSGLRYPMLAPPSFLLDAWNHEVICEEDYAEIYHKMILMDLNHVQVANELTKLTGCKKIVLLCYEKLGDFCHRHIVSKWYNSKTVESEWIYEWTRDGSLLIPERDPATIRHPREVYRGHL